MATNTLGLVSISFRNLTAKTIIEETKKAGLSVIEWGSDVHAPCTDLKCVREIADMQKHYQIACSSYGTYFRLGVNDVSELKAYIEAAKILGTDILRLWCGNKNSQDYSKEETEELFLECKKADFVAKEYGVKLCMECHNKTFTNKKESALLLMQTVNSPNFRMYWQPNQYVSFSENMAYAKLIAPYTEHIHVFNWQGDERFKLGDAVDVWKQYLSNFDGKNTLLLEFMPDNDIASLKEEVQALKRIIE